MKGRVPASASPALVFPTAPTSRTAPLTPHFTLPHTPLSPIPLPPMPGISCILCILHIPRYHLSHRFWLTYGLNNYWKQYMYTRNNVKIWNFHQILMLWLTWLLKDTLYIWKNLINFKRCLTRPRWEYSQCIPMGFLKKCSQNHYKNHIFAHMKKHCWDSPNWTYMYSYLSFLHLNTSHNAFELILCCLCVVLVNYPIWNHFIKSTHLCSST